jgi:Icc protein
MNDKTMWIAQITDTHIKLPGKLAYGVVDTADFLRKAVERLNAQQPRPDLVVITGDLVDAGDPREYAYLRELLAPLEIPFIVVAGNHDERQALREAFFDHTYLPSQGFLHYVIEDKYPLRIIGLDTLIPRSGAGELCAERLNWLSEQLAAAPTKPTLILMHHPPFQCGIAHMEKVGLTGAEALAQVLRPHTQVQAVFCGHLHRNIFTTVGGRPTLCSISTAHQVALDLVTDGPGGFCMEPAGFMMHRWKDGQLLSHCVMIDQFQGPYPFYDAHGKLLD